MVLKPSAALTEMSRWSQHPKCLCPCVSTSGGLSMVWVLTWLFRKISANAEYCQSQSFKCWGGLRAWADISWWLLMTVVFFYFLSIHSFPRVLCRFSVLILNSGPASLTIHSEISQGIQANLNLSLSKIQLGSSCKKPHLLDPNTSLLWNTDLAFLFLSF